MTTLTRTPDAPTPLLRPLPNTAATDRKSEFYRHDLDGLRGVAIALVAMFHVWFGRVSGGVDVFLVLSGFFFGGRLLRAALTPGSSLSPGPEITRLVRRLLPALVVVLAAAAALTILIAPQTRWEAFADQSLASLGYYQNWELAETVASYLRAGEAVSPLQHIWSMSVQGQFYIAFLVFVFGAAFVFRRRMGNHLRRGFVVLLSALTVGSFVFAVFVHQANQSIAYYNSFARGWELLAGALAGALVPVVRWPMWLRTAVATVALAAIVSCGALIDGVREFPGPWTLVPVGATVLMILAAANRQADVRTRDRMPLPNRLLASAPLVTLGAMAYSLYLWHWPLLIFWLSYTHHRHAGFVDGTAVLLVSGVLAYLTTRFVENPLRYRTLPTPRPEPAPLRARFSRPTIALGSAVALLGVALTATSFTWREHVTLQRTHATALPGLTAADYPGARALTAHAAVPTVPMRPTVLEARTDLPETTRDGCISDFGDLTIHSCVYGDKAAARTIALAGGSHAEHWITSLDPIAKRHHVKIVTYLKMGCPLSTEALPTIVGDDIPYPQCRQWVDAVMDRLVAQRPDFVFTNSTRPRFGQPGDEMPASYGGIWDRLSRNDIGILGIRDTPWMERDSVPFEPADCLAEGGTATSCGMKRSDVLNERDPTLDYAAEFPLLKPLDMSDAICRPNICRAVEGNVLVYRDSHHLSASYVRTMTDALDQRVGAATGWW
ncbi:MAG TPA: acyltransferase family protein [Mycobacterium sp.]|jgi:peptidoglycan/LPS O-acetylase OafA/YrhL